MCYWVPQVVLYIKPLLLRQEDVAGLLNIWKQTQRVRQNEERNTFQTKEQDKSSGKDLNETEISNQPDKEFKVMIIKIPTGLEREWMYSVKVRTSTKTNQS